VGHAADDFTGGIRGDELNVVADALSGDDVAGAKLERVHGVSPGFVLLLVTVDRKGFPLEGCGPLGERLSGFREVAGGAGRQQVVRCVGTAA
jgi:hypothetical protein